MAENAKDTLQEEPEATEAHADEAPDYEALYREVLAQSRKWEERAKSNKAKADKWDAYEQEGLSEAEKLARRAEEAEAKLAQLEASAQHERDADEVARATGTPRQLLAYCADRKAMEAFAKEYGDGQHVPAAPQAPASRVIRGDGAKATTADQFAEMAEKFFRH